MAEKVIVFKLRVDTTESKKIGAFEQRIKDLEKAFANLSSTTKSQFSTINASMSKMFPTFQKIGDAGKKAWAMATDVQEFIKGVKAGSTALLSMEVNFKKIAVVAKAVGAALKAVFSAMGGFILAPFQMAWDFITGFFSLLKEGFKSSLSYLKDFAIDATKNFLKFEDALLVVARTATLSIKEMKELGSTLLDMALSVGRFTKGGALEEMGLQAGISANKLAEIAGIAGQLGKSGDEMVGFVNVVAKMSVATDLSASSAATLLATLGNLFDLDASGIERIASVINELGNTTLATQSQIGEMMRRMGGTAAFLGLSADQVAAFAATMREAGVTVRVGGTAMSQFMTKIMTDGAQMAESLGLDWASLKQTLESNNPVPALQLVLQKINEIGQSGGKITVAEKLREMGITGIGLQDTLLKLSQNTGILTKNLNAAKQEWSENDSLAKEYAKTLQTAGHQFDTLGAFIDAIKKVIGQDLAEALGNFTENYLTPMVKTFLEWVKSPEVQDFLKKTLPEALTFVGEKIGEVAEFFAGFMEDVGNMGVWEAFKKAVGTVWGGLKDIISETWETISNETDGKIADIVAMLKAAWEEMKATAAAVWNEVSNTVINALSDIGATIGQVFGSDAENSWNTFVDFLREIPIIVEAIASEITRLMPSINEIVDGMVQVVNLFKDVKGGAGIVGDALKGGYRGFDPISKETNPELFKPVETGIKKATAAAREFQEGISDVTKEAIKSEDEQVGHSTWPEITKGIDRTSVATQFLKQNIGNITDTVRQTESQTISALRNMQAAYDSSFNNVASPQPSAQPLTIANAAVGRTNQYTAPVASTTPTAAPAAGATKQSVIQTITFSGQNVLDESSKNRFAREIGEQIRGLSSTVVRSN